MRRLLRFHGYVAVLALAALLAVPAAADSAELAGASRDLQAQLKPMPHRGAYVIENKDGVTSCRSASRQEAERINRRPTVPLHVIYGGGVRAASHVPRLSITLRGTQQLEQFPQARAAFQAAAAKWEAILQNPIDVIIDVDYGPTRFGEPYPSEDILGSTGSDERGGDVYGPVRSLLISGASSGSETALYSSLPSSALPTNLGSIGRVFGASILLRAMGALAPVQGASDPAPSIGFNSGFAFDFDPSNGIDSNKTDFDAVAVHEIGHALGFNSLVGLNELDPSEAAAASPWDFFRFRPGVTLGSFPSAQRILSSGGNQMFFAGAGELALATGRPDGTGGDEQQASHWKDDADTGINIGIMDPTLSRGERSVMTAADLAVLDVIGWRVSGSGTPPAGTPAAPSNLTATATSSSVIRLNWTDNSNNETEFRVEEKVGSSFVDLGSVGANVTAVNITGLDAGTNFTFRVRARNAAGNSGYSNEANATTAGGGGSPGTCIPGATTLCLSGGRFRVEARYRTPDGQSGNAQAVSITADTGYFWFFDAANIEVIVKLLNACGFANRFWVFGAGLTNVEVTLTITDMRNGTVKTYTNPQGTAFQPVQDTNAFATCP